MANESKCLKCGAPLTPDARDGFCHKCLLGQALAADSAESVSGTGASPALPPPRLTVRYIGDYELLDEIAHGGMGVVWRARQASLDRLVALKMIRAGELASEEEVKRFIREAQAAANLSHPNIVSIYEVGRHEGMHYFSMRLVEGRSLAQEMADAGCQKPDGRAPAGLRHPVSGISYPIPKAARLVATVARAVHHAHERGILHRDLKPGNILIDASGEPHVTDFGLAKRVDMPSDLTRTESVMGTPNYMSPEQAQGRNHDLTPASDIFSLGAVFYHLLTDRPPFQAATAWETLKAVVEREPVRPRALNRRVDRDLETICLKCLEKDPPRRYASAEELAGDLDRWLKQEPIRARPVSEWDYVVKWVKRNQAIASLAAVVMVVATVGLAGWLVARERAAAVGRAQMAQDEADKRADQKTQEAAAVLAANHDLLLQQAFGDTNNARGPVLLKALEAAISRQRTNFLFWQAKATVLQRTNRLEEAIAALSSAIDLLRPDPGESRKPLIGSLLARSRLLRQVGRQQEADMDYTAAGSVVSHWKGGDISTRDPQSRPELLDLSPFFNSTLSNELDHIGTEGSEAVKTIREAVKQSTGVEFDLRGHLGVCGRRELEQYRRRKPVKDVIYRLPEAILPPEALAGIAVNRRFVRLHVLHATSDMERDGQRIGAYVLRYADGLTNELDIIYGHHLRDCWGRDRRPSTHAVVAWQGMKRGSSTAVGAQFFMATWENPRPEEEVRSIDLVATAEDLNLCLLGITVEEAKPDEPEYWTTKARELEEQRDRAGATAVLEQALEKLGGNPVLWNAKAEMSERAGRPNEALQALSKAIELASADTNAFGSLLTDARLNRASLLRQMNRIEEAIADNLAAHGIPPRSPQAGPEQIDLGLVFNRGLLSYHNAAGDSAAANTMPDDVRKVTGVAFDLRGVVRLAGTNWVQLGHSPAPQTANGIPVGRAFARMHVVHSTSKAESDGVTIGAYVLHYADGQQQALPIIYGEHLRERDSPAKPEMRAPTSAVVCWSYRNRNGWTRRLYATNYENPRPKVAVKRIDFVSNLTKSGPFLIAITVEP